MPTRLLRGALVAALAATALSPLGTTAQTAPLTCADEARRLRPDGWTLLTRPSWSVGEQKIVSWAASAHLDGLLLATNGRAVMRTTDFGCTWEEVYSPGLLVGEFDLGSTAEVFGVAMPPTIGRLGYPAYAVVAGLDRTKVVVSEDRGRTWAESPSVGLPPLARMHSIKVSPNPNIVYVLADAQSTPLNAVVETALYISRDRGQTFAPVRRGLQPTQYTEFAVDPADARHVWAWDDVDIWHSTDSGTTWQETGGFGSAVEHVDVAHFPAYEPARITIYRKDRSLASRSEDGGVTWTRYATPGRVTGSANAAMGMLYVTTSDVGVFVDAPMYKLVQKDISPRKLTFTELAWGPVDFATTLYATNGNDLYLRRFTQKAIQNLINLRGPGRLQVGPNQLFPANHVERLKPGQTKKIEYTLDLSPVPTPLDIFFATDSTGSMSGVIGSLRNDLQDIIDDLAERGIDVWFGIGDFKDYSTWAGPNDYPYKLHREVGPVDEELEDAINGITTGGGNQLDSALTATYQAATGAGQRRLDESGALAGWWVEPGEGAEWREEALKVIVIAADVRSRTPETEKGYPGPTHRQVVNALNLLGIEHVGLAVGSSPAAPQKSLARVSRGTGTVAPRGGIDCDDDGEVDLKEGEPLVCEVNGSGTNLSPAMVALLESLEDRQPVSWRLKGERQVARLLGDTMVPDVDVKEPNTMRFTVQVRCDVDTAGETFEHVVEARVARRTVATAALTVKCAGLPKRRPVIDIPQPIQRVLAAAVIPPPPPAPAPVPQTQVNSNPNPNANPNPQPVTQVQAGVAYQQQVEVQLQTATDEVRTEGELAMSGLRDTDAAAAGVLCAGMVLAAGGAVALRRRTRPQVAKVRSSG